MSKKTDKLHAIHENHKAEFEPGLCSFHNLLWQIMINEVRKDTESAFAVAPSKDQPGRWQIGIADADVLGYTPTEVILVTKDYNEASGVLEKLNREVFGLDTDAAHRIVARSMRLRRSAYEG